MTIHKEALKALVHEMEYVLSCINEDKIPFDGDDFHEALRLGKEALTQPEQDKERCVGCEACIDTACGRDECPKGWPKAAQPEQEPVAWDAHGAFDGMRVPEKSDLSGGWADTAPPQRKPLTEWIDPNDKTQERFLPNIGEPVLFCHSGSTYFGKHNGGSFEHRGIFDKRYFNTWECHWMPLPAAHGIKD